MTGDGLQSIRIFPWRDPEKNKRICIASSKLKEIEEMGQNLVQKILKAHLVSGSIESGKVISLSVDQTLMHDATGQMAALEF